MGRTSTSVTFSSPVGGWDTRNALSDMPIENAVKLDNWFPTTDRVIMRRGFVEHATGMIGDVETLIEYVSITGDGELFAANNGAIYDVTSVGDVGDAVVGEEPATGYDLNNLSEVQVTKSVVSEDNNPTGITFNDTGSKMYMVGSANDSIHEYDLSTPFDLSTKSSVQVTKSVASEDTVPNGIVFNDTGSKIYMVGSANDSIYEYNLSISFDLSSLLLSGATESVASEDTVPNGIVLNNDGTKIYMVGSQNDSIYEYNLSTPFDLSTKSVVQVTESVASEDTVPTGIVFNDTGSKIYMVGSENDSIYEYNLSTAFDLSSLLVPGVTESSVSSEDNNPNGIAFNNDGSKVYMVGSTNDSIHEYDLSTPFDISTKSSVQVTESVASEDTVPSGIAFNDDGTKVYMVGDQNDSIYEYNLSTAFDLSTKSVVQVTKSVASEDATPNGIAFNNDGSKIYMVGSSNDSIYEYDLSTPFDLSTKSVVQVTKSVASEDNNPRGMAFNDTGSKVYVVGIENVSIYEYNLSTPFDLSTKSSVQATESVSSEDNDPSGISFNNDGTKLYMVGAIGAKIYEYSLTTPFDISTRLLSQVTESVASEDTASAGIALNNDGSKIYMVGSANDSIYEYDLSTPFDLSTKSVVQVTKSVASEDTVPNGITFNDTGSKIYMVGSANDSIYEYDLSTPFDLSTKSVVQVTKSVASEDNDPTGIAFNDTGTKIYMVGSANDSIYEYNLGTPFDISSLGPVTESVSSEDTDPTGIALNNDGTKIYMVGAQNKSIYEYNLSTPFDLSTKSVVQVTESVASEDNNPTGMTFNDTGSKIYMVGSANDSIYEYNLSTPFDLSTKSVVQVTKSVASEDTVPNGIVFNDTGSKIYMVGSANDSIYEYDLSSGGPLLNNKWQYVQISTAAGQFLSLMNGASTPLVYNGSAWGTTPTIIGPTITNLIWNNIHQRRLWCGEIDSLSAWYLPVNNIGGSAQEFPLGGIARLGGYIMAMGTWTRDSGEGMDDVAVFVTSEGEAIVYNGIDPASATTWQLIGVFRIGKPIGRRCIVKAGTDVVIITQDGFVPLSAILSTDRSQSRLVALSDQIAKAVNDSVREFKDVFGWQPIVYPKGTQIVFNVPQSASTYHQYVFNTITGAPCRYIGMNGLCWALLNDDLFFGGVDGKTYQADTGLSDNGVNVDTDAIQAFSYFKSKSVNKLFKLAEPIFESTGNPNAAVDFNTDFNIKLPTATPQASTPNAAIWGISLWGVGVWGTDGIIFRGWRGIRGLGRAGSVRVRIKSTSSNTSWISTSVNFVKGGQL
ncbi:MAG: hypothetical protein V3U88_08630 [Methylococcales bacterium]